MTQISFRLRFGDRDILLRAGETIFGRTETCTIMLDDALLSREHARLLVAGDAAVLEDLESKNGTYVNEVRIVKPVQLHNGDQIRLGHTRMELTVLRRRVHSSQSLIRTKGFPTQADDVPMMGDLSDVLFRMLQMGRLDEAEKILKSRVANLTGDAETLAVNHLMSRNVQEGLLIMAERSMDGIWLHRLLKLHVSCDWLMSADIQQKAEQLIRAVGKLEGDGLRAYVSHWAARAEELQSPQQSQLERLRDLASREE